MQADFYLLSSPDEQARYTFLCRLIEKIYRQSHTLYVYCKDQHEAEQLDELLWTFNETSFIPHCLLDEAPSSPPPVLLGSTKPTMKREVFINLSTTIPLFYNSFQRILEIVSSVDEQQTIAREHYQFYKTQNIVIKTHKIG